MKKHFYITLLFVFAIMFIFSACNNEGELTFGNEQSTNSEISTDSEQTSNNDGVCRHTYGDWSTVKQATCKEEGELVRTCTKCYKQDKSTVAKTNKHKDFIIKKGYSATCTTDGLTDSKGCSVCNIVLSEQTVISAYGHIEIVDNGRSATCTNEGLTDGKHCSTCGKTLVIQTTIKAYGHTEVIIEAVDATCTKEGLSVGKQCSVYKVILLEQQKLPMALHEYVDGFCKNCSIGDEISKSEELVREATRHRITIEKLADAHANLINNWQTRIENLKIIHNISSVYDNLTCHEKVNELEATIGDVEYEISYLELMYGDDVSYRAQIYQLKKEKESLEAEKAKYEAMIDIIFLEEAIVSSNQNYESDIQEENDLYEKNKTLIELKYAKDSSICKKHKWGEWTTILESTCTDIGRNTRYCETCSLVDNGVIEKIDHIEVIDNYVAPSCSQTGLTEGSHCSMCNKTITEQKVISKTEHKHIVVDALQEPTCDVSGLTEGSHCTDCNTIIVAQVVIPATGHERYVYEIINPTCIEYGYTTYKCRNCDYSNSENQVDPLNHSYLIEVTRKEPTCVSFGNVTRQCQRCTEKNTETLVPTGHNFADDICTKCEQNVPTDGLTYSGSVVTGLGTATSEAAIVISDISPHSGTYYDQKLYYHVITEIEDNAFENCENIEVVIIPKTITKIGAYAFSGCTNLKAVIAHDNITSIGTHAFSGCSSLTNITIPNSTTQIGAYAFSGCTNLNTVIMHDNITSIGAYAFSNCSSLTNITIPNSITSIGLSAFEGCNSLAYNEYDNAYYLGNKENPYLVLMKAKDSLITNCIINENTKRINGYAFLDCTLLENIIIPNSVETIGSSAFYGCTSLTAITIPTSVINIGGGAFTDCRNLASIVIPNSVTTVAYCAISGVTSAMIYCEAESQPNSWDSYWVNSNSTVVWGYKYVNIDGVFYGIKNSVATVVRQPKNIESIEIPISIVFEGQEYPVTQIDDYAFYECKLLTSVTIGDSVNTIGDYAFVGCSKLASIVVPNSVTTIGDYAFNTWGTISIYCEVTKKPSGWSSTWNAYKSVVWGHTHSYTDGECICGVKENKI